MILLWVFLARQWTVQAFGQFSSVFAWVAVYGLVADLGLDFWVTRQTALKKSQAYPLNLVIFKLLFSLLTAALFVLLAWLAGLPMRVFLIFLGGTILLNLSHFFSCYLRGCEKLSTEAMISLVRNSLFILLAATGVYYQQQLLWVAICYSVSCLLTAIMTWFAVKRHGFVLCHQRLPLSVPLKTAFGVWITYLLVGLSVKLDILLLGQFGDEKQVALYSAAARIFEGGLLLATAFVLTLFPVLTKTVSNQPAAYYSQVIKQGKLLLLLTLVAAVAGMVLGSQFFTLLYGPQYQQSRQLFIYLMMILPVSALVYFLYNVLVIAARAKPVMILLALGVVINVVLDWWLIPLLGVEGVIVSFYIKECVLLLGLFMLLQVLKKKEAMSEPSTITK